MCSASPNPKLTDADLLEAASRLPERQRLAFFLVAVRGLSVRKAARAMGVKHPAVSRSLRRASQNLGYDLLEGLDASTDAACAG